MNNESYVIIPEGEYVADIIEMSLKRDNKNRKVAEWKLKIVGGPLDQQMVTKRYYLIKESVANFLKREMKILGIDIVSSADFDVKKEQAVGKRITFGAQINETGSNDLYVRTLVKLPEANTTVPVEYDW